MVKRFPKSHKLIDLALDEVHEFGAGLGTLDDSLELVLDLFNMPTIWISICVIKGEHGKWWIVESEELREPKWIQQKHKKLVCLGGSRGESQDLGFPCLWNELWLEDKDESHQYICRVCSQ